MSTTPESRPPLPPFTAETARQKVRLAEDAWNSRDAQRVSLAYTVDTVWRNRAEFPVGRAQAQAFLERKWARETVPEPVTIRNPCGIEDTISRERTMRVTGAPARQPDFAAMISRPSASYRRKADARGWAP
jgi:hypothetical protein